MNAPTIPAITIHAHALANAERTHRQGNEALIAAKAHLALIHDRIVALVAQRAAIVDRRAAGDPQPDDAGALALITADIEGLEAMKPDAEAVIAAARYPVQAASQAIEHARTLLAKAEAEATESTLIEHAGKLGELLLETVTRLGQIETTLSRRLPVWGPSRPLIDALRRRQAMLGTL